MAYADEVAEAEAHNAVVENKFGGVTAPENDDTKVVVKTSTQLVDKPKRKAIIRRKPKPANTTLPMALFGLLFLLVCGHYKNLSAANGFCDNNSKTNSIILGRELPIKAAQDCLSQRAQWQVDHPNESPAVECDISSLPLVPFLPRPTHCTPCPPNADCVRGEVVACDPEYILKPSLLSPLSPLFDGWPTLPSRVFAPSCKPDTARMRHIGQLATQIERHLATVRGTIECANMPQDKNVGPGVRYGISEAALQNYFTERRVVSCCETTMNHD